MTDRTEPSGLKLPDSQRQAILYLEILGLIHDLGKLTDGFIKKEAEGASTNEKKYEYRFFVDPLKLYTDKKPGETITEWQQTAHDALCAFKLRTDLTDSLMSLSFTAWDESDYSLAELVPFLSRTEYWRKNDQWIRELGKSMQPGSLIGFLHGIAHFDKESSGVHFSKQASTDTWRSTPFGYDVEQLPVGPAENLTTVFQQLPLSHVKIHEATQSAERREAWFDLMEKGLRKGLADTCRPINDVTLWDWGYLVASLAKAASYYLFNHGWPESLEHLPFRTLRINLDKLRLYADSDGITDLLGKQNAIDEAYRKVRQYIEFDLALGNRIHHDETGEYYLIPGILPSKDPTTALRQSIQDIFRQESLEDCLPRVHFGQEVTAGELDGKDRMEAVKHLLVNPRQNAESESLEAPVQYDNNLYLFEDEWSTGKPENAERCSVCGLRPVGYPATGDNPETEKNLQPWAREKKAKERHLCRICLNRRGRRAKKWAEEWAIHLHDHAPPTTVWADEAADDNGRIALFVGCFGLKHWLDGSALETTRLSGNNGKNPSPARLFRITETTRSFWSEVNTEVLPETVTAESTRLVLTPASTEGLDLGSFHTYVVESRDIRISVVWDSERKYFLSVENLSGLMKRHGYSQDMLSMMKRLQNSFNGRECLLFQPSSYGNASCRLSSILFRTACLYPGYYRPIIPLLAEPGVCMNLIPADKAIDVSMNVLEKYQEEMNRVQDRLPMGIGLVFFPRRTPVRTVMEAGRAMLKMLKDKPETWVVTGKKDIDNNVDITFDDEKNSNITLSYETLSGRNTGPRDTWHLWCLDRESTPKKINALSMKQTVLIYPGRFDFEFLDTSGRRFDIHYDEQGRRPRNTRPFYLTDIQRFTGLWQHIRSLSKSQIHQVIELIETKRTEWRIAPGTTDERTEVFRKFVQSTLADAEWPVSHSFHTISEREALVQAGVDGVLTDIVELYLSILKSQPTENPKA